MNYFPECKAGQENLSLPSSSSQRKLNPTTKSLFNWTTDKEKPNEHIEVYAAELKKMYAKSYPSRDENTRREDLLRKIFDGLKYEI